jgi:hypothetical protein
MAWVFAFLFDFWLRDYSVFCGIAEEVIPRRAVVSGEVPLQVVLYGEIETPEVQEVDKVHVEVKQVLRV